MNERIKSLSDIAYKNYLAKNKHSSFSPRSDYVKEFAELIIQECVGRIQLHNRMDEVTEQWVYDNLVSDVKEHFGVE